MARTYQYSVNVVPSYATNPNVSWSVVGANEDAMYTGQALIDQTGLLTPTAPGTIRVVASALDASGVNAYLNVVITTSPILVRDLEFVTEGDVNLTEIYLDPASI